ncbi:Syntenin-1 [Schistosoma japonicum]|nr:Syntenin-1 [Schistosoma japonicum]
MNSPSILKTARRSRGYRSLSNEMSNETDTELSIMRDIKSNNRNSRRTSATLSSVHYATNLVYNLLSPKYSPVFHTTRLRQKLYCKESNKPVNRMFNLHSSISSGTSSLESLNSLSSTDLLPSNELSKKHSRKITKSNEVRRIIEEKRNNYQFTECDPLRNKDTNISQNSINTCSRTRRVNDGNYNDKPSTNKSLNTMNLNSKVLEKSYAFNKILNLPINRIKKDHLCTTQSAPCSPIFIKKERTTTPTRLTHTLFNSEKNTSPHLKKKHTFHLNPENKTSTSSSTSLFPSNVKNYLNGNLLNNRNKSNGRKVNNNINKLNNLQLTQLELNSQKFKMIHEEVNDVNANNKSILTRNIKVSLNIEHSEKEKNEFDSSIIDNPGHILNSPYPENIRRIETPPPSYSDLTIFNPSPENPLPNTGNNVDNLVFNYKLFSKIDEPLHIHRDSKYTQSISEINQPINKLLIDNIADNYNDMAAPKISLNDSSTELTDQNESYRKVVLQRHNTTERFGMRLERTKGVRQVTYIAMILPRSPAQLAGLKVGDRLIRVNELETDQMLLDELLNYIRKSNGPLYLYYQTRPFTSYLLTTVIRKQNGKIGIKLRSCKNELRIDVVLPNSPASRVGLRSGQQVVSLNGQCVHGWDQLTAMHWFRHYPDGVDLTITVLDELDKTENMARSRTTQIHDTLFKTDTVHENNQKSLSDVPSNAFAALNSPSKNEQITLTQFHTNSFDSNITCENQFFTSSTVASSGFIFSEQESQRCQDESLDPLVSITKHESGHTTASLNNGKCLKC